jgi:hypothetical protein
MTTLREFESRTELDVYLSAALHPVLIGADYEYPSKYYAVSLPDNADGEITIGIILNYHGIPPSWIFSASRSVLVVGHDESISFIDVPERCLTLTRRLPWVFYKFLPEPDRAHFLALHELGVARFDFSGKELWSILTPDITENATMRQDGILVVRHQGPTKELLVDIESGHIHSEPRPTP